MAHTLPHPAGIVLVPSPTPTSISIRIPFRSPMDGSGSSTWPVLWRRPVALAGKLQLIPKLRMKSNCSLAHSVVLRSALPPVLLLHHLQPSPVQCLFVCSVVLFCFYILLTADYSSCSALVCPTDAGERREHPPPSSPSHLNSPRSPQCMIFILRLSFIFLMSLIPYRTTSCVE